MSHARPHQILIGATLTILIPGAGHVYYGEASSGFKIVGAAMVATIALSYFAALGPWAGLMAFAFNILFHLVVLAMLIRVFRSKPRVAMPPKHAGALILLVFVHAGLHGLRRVQTLETASSWLEPQVLAGDALAVDRNPHSPYEVGQIVVAEIPARPGEYVRKIVSLTEDQAVLGTNSQEFPEETVARENITGRVLYVMFSRAPGTYSFRWNRIFADVPANP